MERKVTITLPSCEVCWPGGMHNELPERTSMCPKCRRQIKAAKALAIAAQLKMQGRALAEKSVPYWAHTLGGDPSYAHMLQTEKRTEELAAYMFSLIFNGLEPTPENKP